MDGKTRDTSSELHAETPAEARESEQSDPEPAHTPSHPRSADRAGLVVAAAVLAVCGGLVLYGVFDTGQADAKPERRTPAAAVTYEVTGQGTADITYQARSETGRAVVVKAAGLPWRKTVDVPLGKEPIVSIVLGEKGGQARCVLAVRGRHVQSATATGAFGRATCSGVLPAVQGGKAD
ncbi:hypothetical protein [Streptomyces sp. HUAS ZL42]|uniref:hypothetical protein n=1 Tax=Streptomyces sp. HUAS ZL42 TaxID=3231715 RepID=UPI00345E6AE3